VKFVLSGKGSKNERCIHAAFCVSVEDGQKIADYYDRCYDDFPFPHVCMDIIKAEYKKRVDALSGIFLFNLITSMIQTHTEASDWENEIKETINEFMVS
jgi:hypothetical protein